MLSTGHSKQHIHQMDGGVYAPPLTMHCVWPELATYNGELTAARLHRITPLATDKLPGSSHEQHPSHLAGAVLELVDGDARDEQQQCFTLRGRKGEGVVGEAQG